MCGLEDMTERGKRFIVDHILPRRTHPELELERANLQLLCYSCHERVKAAAERAYLGRRDAIRDRPQSVAEDGRHTDPRHPWGPVRSG